VILKSKTQFDLYNVVVEPFSEHETSQDAEHTSGPVLQLIEQSGFETISVDGIFVISASKLTSSPESYESKCIGFVLDKRRFSSILALQVPVFGAPEISQYSPVVQAQS